MGGSADGASHVGRNTAYSPASRRRAHPRWIRCRSGHWREPALPTSRRRAHAARPGGRGAEGVAVVNGFGSITSIEVTSSGSQYRGAPTVTIADPTSGTTAEASPTMAPVYYTINSATPVTAGVSTITSESVVADVAGSQ